MADRRRVVYKTPLHRISETALIFLPALGSAALCHALIPAIATQVAIVPFLVVGYLFVPALGTQLALRRGAPLMTPEERTRRYLSELGPIGLAGRPGIAVGHAARRSGGRSVRRG